MSCIRVLGSASAVAIAIFAAACSSEPPMAPSRPPTPRPTAPADGGDGVGSGACFDTSKTKPASPSDFLNQCNGTECFPFDNATRIEGFKPGATLPPLG